VHRVHGIHHVTAIAGDPQANLDFYSGVLGMRLVKRSVNQDDPGTYHLFYADADGSPGSDLTFFPWVQLAPGRRGFGLAIETALAVPRGSLDYWAARLRDHGVATRAIETRFDERALPFADPHGLEVALVEATREGAVWEQGPVPVEHQVRGLHSVRLLERELAPTVAFAEEALGFAPLGEENGWRRFGAGGDRSGQLADLRSAPEAPRGAWGTGAIHHVAWRVADEAEQLAVRGQTAAAGAHPTPVIDRFWFKSVYFREPGGVLFELATDGPGFTVDETRESLGGRLILPPWLEPRRSAIEQALPPLREAATRTSRY
jgi:glyoxalase family protein